jgi:hypothetical protein
MRETFRNVSIFIVFVMALILWDVARRHMASEFDFRFGRTTLMCLWSVGVLILFHLLYHFLGRAGERVVYLSTVVSAMAMAGLLYFNMIALR